MNERIQDEAISALRDFLSDPSDIDAFEQRIADLWFANERELDGILGDIYDIVMDWDHKYEEAEAVAHLRDLHASFERG
ncbi:MAG TPA: hypothetical protein VF701_21040 [Thermoanaerobaculia bacterium]